MASPVSSPSSTPPLTRQNTQDDSCLSSFSSSSFSGPSTPSSSQQLPDDVTKVVVPTQSSSFNNSDGDGVIETANSSQDHADNEDNPEPPKKKLKITAWNGWEALRRVKSESQLSKKRTPKGASQRTRGVKKEGSEKAEVEGASGRVKTRRKAGKLAGLVSLPLDVLYEVFSHLSPHDLLHLSRTTKSIRRTILSKNAISLWKDVFAQQDDLPPCPDDMSLPAWASLVFEAHCHHCLTKNVRNVEWMLRMRLCEKCAKALLFCEDQLRCDDKKLDRLIRACVPFQKRKGKLYCLTSAKDAFIRELDSMEGDRNAFVEERQKEMKRRREHAQECAMWSEDQEIEREAELLRMHRDRKEFIMERLEALGYGEEIEFLVDLEEETPGQLALPIPTWDDFVPFEEHPEVRPCKPLTERVWNNRVKNVMLEYMEKVRRYRKDNDRNLELEDRRWKLAERWLEWRRLPEVLEAFPPSEFMPSVADFLEMDITKKVIEWTPPTQEELATPNPLTLRPVSGKDPLPTFFATEGNGGKGTPLAQAIDEWRAAQTFKVYALTPFAWHQPFDPIPANIESMQRFLQLAICVLECEHVDSDPHFCFVQAQNPSMTWGKFYSEEKNQYSCMWYPEFLEHQCNRLDERHWNERKLDWNPYLWVEEILAGPPSPAPVSQSHGLFGVNPRRNLKRIPFRPDGMGFHFTASLVVKNILAACGYHWANTTAAMMDEVDPRVVCLKCSFGNRCDGERIFSVHTWRNAVKHALYAHSIEPKLVEWERISDEDAAKARELEKLEPARRGVQVEPRRDVKCFVCWGGSDEHALMTLEETRQHLKKVHRKTDEDLTAPDAEGSLWFRATYLPSKQPLTIRLIPKPVEKREVTRPAIIGFLRPCHEWIF
ncbi:hypothetical protein CC1G_09948 [Coprinopsis cinerea okayama7|uniref:F-box domain-containing protein n=1 Tax=Coprinopsis cinerea (strain Okayama-7 / 130 / ATCC MYA-4618 / FGSC 9003) TaxID=240176 RepID=A8PGQ6_COPC7|nr:hypothetical protein CC1G_09948 [Coprinopsis cinerea okayama7\|eukprot:XP_001841256.1 hypothetical protein CC1G_09948 [Coprinopsis cinerea okayama7\